MKFRFIALVTAFTFIVQSVYQGAPAALEMPQFHPFLDIQIPRELGEIQASAFNPQNQNLIIHIQDAHGNYKAQQNTAKLLEHLEKRYGVKTLFLEGAAGKLIPEQFHFFDNRKLDLKVADLMMKRGAFTGAELFLVRSSDFSRYLIANKVAAANSNVQAFGIEDPVLYRKNFEAFEKAIRAQSGLEARLKKLKSEMRERENRIFSKELRDLTRAWEAHLEDNSDWMRYLSLLNNFSRKHLLIDLKDPKHQIEFPNLVRYFNLEEQDPEKVSGERQKFLEFLKGKIGEELYERIARPEEAKPYPRFLFEELHEELLKKKIALPGFQHYFRYAGNLMLQSEMQSKEMFEEMNRLAEKIFGVLAKTPEARAEIDRIKERILLEKLVRLELTRDEWKMVCRSGFSRLKTANKFATTSFNFYRTAIARESAFLKSIESISKQKNIRRSVLITGGFHSDFLSAQLKESGLSFITIRPNFGGAANIQKNYQRAMLPETSHLVRALELNEPAALEALVSPRWASVYKLERASAIREVSKAASLGDGRESPRLGSRTSKETLIKRLDGVFRTARARKKYSAQPEPVKLALSDLFGGARRSLEEERWGDAVYRLWLAGNFANASAVFAATVFRQIRDLARVIELFSLSPSLDAWVREGEKKDASYREMRFVAFHLLLKNLYDGLTPFRLFSFIELSLISAMLPAVDLAGRGIKVRLEWRKTLSDVSQEQKRLHAKQEKDIAETLSWVPHTARTKNSIARVLRTAMATGEIMSMLRQLFHIERTERWEKTLFRKGFSYAAWIGFIHHYALFASRQPQDYWISRTPRLPPSGTGSSLGVADLVGGEVNIRYLNRIREIVNEDLEPGKETTALYIASGTDISTLLIATDADRLIMVDMIPFDLPGYQLEQRQRADYLSHKKKKSYAQGVTLHAVGVIRPLLEMELGILGATNIRMTQREEDRQVFDIRFLWNEKPRHITFVSSTDGRKFEEYEKFLNESGPADFIVLKAGQYAELPYPDRAAMLQPFGRIQPFAVHRMVNRLTKDWLREGGSFISDIELSSGAGDGRWNGSFDYVEDHVLKGLESMRAVFGYDHVMIYKKPANAKSLGSAGAEDFSDMAWVRSQFARLKKKIKSANAGKLNEIDKEITNFASNLMSYWQKKERPRDIIQILEQVWKIHREIEGKIQIAEFGYLRSFDFPSEVSTLTADSELAKTAVETFHGMRILIPQGEIRKIKEDIDALHARLASEAEGEIFETCDYAYEKLMDNISITIDASTVSVLALIRLGEKLEEYIKEAKKLLADPEIIKRSRPIIRLQLSKIEKDDFGKVEKFFPKLLFPSILRDVNEKERVMILGLVNDRGVFYPATPEAYVFGTVFDMPHKVNVRNARGLLHLITLGWQVVVMNAETAGEETDLNDVRAVYLAGDGEAQDGGAFSAGASLGRPVSPIFARLSQAALLAGALGLTACASVTGPKVFFSVTAGERKIALLTDPAEVSGEYPVSLPPGERVLFNYNLSINSGFFIRRTFDARRTVVFSESEKSAGEHPSVSLKLPEPMDLGPSGYLIVKFRNPSGEPGGRWKIGVWNYDDHRFDTLLAEANFSTAAGSGWTTLQCPVLSKKFPATNMTFEWLGGGTPVLELRAVTLSRNPIEEQFARANSLGDSSSAASLGDGFVCLNIPKDDEGDAREAIDTYLNLPIRVTGGLPGEILSDLGVLVQALKRVFREKTEEFDELYHELSRDLELILNEETIGHNKLRIIWEKLNQTVDFLEENIDGWSPDSAETIQKALRSFEFKVEKFGNLLPDVLGVNIFPVPHPAIQFVVLALVDPLGELYRIGFGNRVFVNSKNPGERKFIHKKDDLENLMKADWRAIVLPLGISLEEVTPQRVRKLFYNASSLGKENPDDLEEVIRKAQSYRQKFREISDEELPNLVLEMIDWQDRLLQHWREKGKSVRFRAILDEINSMIKEIRHRAIALSESEAKVRIGENLEFRMKAVPDVLARPAASAYFGMRIIIREALRNQIRSDASALHALLQEIKPGQSHEMRKDIEAIHILYEQSMHGIDTLSGRGTVPYGTLLIFQLQLEAFHSGAEHIIRGLNASRGKSNAVRSALENFRIGAALLMSEAKPLLLKMQKGSENRSLIVIGVMDPEGQYYPATGNPLIYGSLLDPNRKKMFVSIQGFYEAVKAGWRAYVIPHSYAREPADVQVSEIRGPAPGFQTGGDVAGASLGRKDSLEIAERRNVELEILNNFRRPMTRAELHRNLTQFEGYAQIGLVTVHRDVRADRRLSRHKNLTTERIISNSQKIQARRDKIFEILESRPSAITVNQLHQKLIQAEGFEDTGLFTVYQDIYRNDRLVEHQNLIIGNRVSVSPEGPGRKDKLQSQGASLGRAEPAAMLEVARVYANKIVFMPEAADAEIRAALKKLGVIEQETPRPVDVRIAEFNRDLTSVLEYLRIVRSSGVSRFSAATEAAATNKRGVAVILDDFVFKNGMTQKEIARKIAEIMREKDSVSVIWEDRKPSFISNLRQLVNRKLKVTDVRRETVTDAVLSSLTKNYDVPAIWISAAGQKSEMQVSFANGDKIKLNLEVLAQHGIDPAQVIALLRQIADYPETRRELFIRAGFKPNGDGWEAGEDFVQTLLQKISLQKNSNQQMQSAA